MSPRSLALLAVLGLLSGLAHAEAPEEAVRPPARSVALAAPDRPELPSADAAGGWAGERPSVRPVASEVAEPVTMPPGEPAPGAAFVLDPVDARPRARPEPVLARGLAPQSVAAAPAYLPNGRRAVVLLGLPPTIFAVARAMMPKMRPTEVSTRAARALAEARRGQVCGNPLLQGEAVGAVGSGGCGIEGPVRLRSVDGVRLSDGSLMDCTTAEALLTWVREGARPAIGSRGGGLVGIDVMGHYACRPRNNQRGARLSEHGRGRAIDIGGLILADGSTLSVRRDWPDSALRQMHSAACGTFSTVLGPAANAQHHDHFHFDTARGRGPYCR